MNTSEKNMWTCNPRTTSAEAIDNLELMELNKVDLGVIKN